MAMTAEAGSAGASTGGKNELDCAAAEALGGKICTAASLSAQSECQLLELIGEFDTGNAVRWWAGVTSLAHWLSWACSMSPGTAREHVRVARALRQMPTVTAAFREGRLSYSKVREISRVVDLVDETELCELALTATAAQLARMIAGYRTAAGARITQERLRRLTWTERESGIIDLRVRLPKEEAAVLLAALNTAKDQHSPPPGNADSDTSADSDTTPAYGLVDALLDVARTYLAAAPEDRSGEDRHLVVVHVNADLLADPARGQTNANVPAGTPGSPLPDDPPAHDDSPADVPAGTSDQAEPTCHIDGLGGIEPETARKLSCDADLLGAIINASGDVLALGRTRRLVTRAQRRALMIRDHGICQFTGCHQTRHLHAHHIIHWFDGGPTDLDNLILLCHRHHTVVHEGGMIIHRISATASGSSSSARRWEFLMPDGSPHRHWYTADGLLNFLTQHADQTQAEQQRSRRASLIDNVASFHHPHAQRIQPGWRGERFSLHECVQALFRMPPTNRPEAQAA